MFVIIPEQLVKRKSPEHLQIYCDLYLLEFQNKNYNLREVSNQSNLSYRQCRSLRDLARRQLNNNKPKLKLIGGYKK